MSQPETTPPSASLEWLLTACRAWLLPGPPLAVERTPNWQTACRLACRHGLEPLLHALLAAGRLPGEAPPAVWAERWEAAYYRNFVFNNELLEALSPFLARCREGGLAVVVFKGPVNAARAYGDPALRVMHDVDLLCREEDLERLAALAREAGFDAAAETAVYHASFAHRELELGVELHFDLYGFLADRSHLLEQVLSQRETVELAGLGIPAPSPAASLLLEAAHLVNHDFGVQLRSLVDFAALLTRVPFERERLGQLLERHDLQEEFALSAHLVTELFCLPGPASHCDLRRARDLRHRALDQMAAPRPADERAALAEAAARPGLAARLRYALRLLFPPLSHLRAVRGTGSSALALLHLPGHLVATVGRGWRNWRTLGIAPSLPPPGSIKGRAFARRGTDAAERGPR